MALSIKTNVNSLAVQRRIGESTSRVVDSLSKLSSGLRINSSVDDPSGQSLAYNLKFNATIKNRGRANVSDGISALGLVDGVLENVSNLLNRMAELAEQAANGQYTSVQRRALNKEYSALDQEIRRIADSTDFNGSKLLRGTGRGGNVRQVTNISGGTGATVGFTGQGLATSGDGKYVTYYNGTSGAIEQVNSETGEVKTISSVAILGDLRSSGNGETVIFTSVDNINGLNPSGAHQIFKYDRLTETITRITSAQGLDTYSGLELSQDGTTLAFTSNTTYTNGGLVSSSTGFNAAAEDLYTVSLSTGVVSKLNGASVGTTYSTLSLSNDGSYLSYLSNSNTLGTNADLNNEIFVAQSNSLSSTQRQVTSTTGVGLTSSQVSDDGFVYFTSTYNHTGGNSALNAQVFKYSFDSSSTSQLTSFGSATIAAAVLLSADGSFVSLLSNGNYTNENSQGAVQSFRIDTSNGQAVQTTSFTSLYPYSSVVVSRDGGSIVFSYADDFDVGKNSDLSGEIFISDISRATTDVSISAGSTGVNGKIATTLSALQGALKGLGATSLTSQSSARGALETTKDNISRLGTLQSQIGTYLSRLDSAQRLLLHQNDIYKEAYSKITDADVAQETANLLRNQVVQDAATAILAQANQVPQIVLQLIATS